MSIEQLFGGYEFYARDWLRWVTRTHKIIWLLAKYANQPVSDTEHWPCSKLYAAAKVVDEFAKAERRK